MRERSADIPQLFAAVVAEAKPQLGRTDFALTAVTRRHPRTHGWPGNVRALRNFAVQAALGPAARLVDAKVTPLPRRVDQFEAEPIRDALRQTGGSVIDAPRLLGRPRKTFYDKVTRPGIALAEFRRSGQAGG